MPPFAQYTTRAEIDLDALAFNLSQVRGLAGQRPILAVVKANAYGHGAVGIARELEALGVDFLGVAFVEEGIQLRQAGIRKPILVLSGVLPFQVKEVFAFKLTPVIFDLALAQLLDAEGKRQNRVLSVHVKIDTGMNRLGVGFDQAEKFFTEIRPLNHLRVEGVLSHFSSAHLHDEESQQFSAEQAEKFKALLARLKTMPVTPAFIHMSNSSALMGGLVPDFTLVRAGLMLYGAYSSEEQRDVIPLQPVMSLKTKVLQIGSVPAGSPIGYSRSFYTQRESLIATVGIGYGDGYQYRLSNRGQVLIQGKRAPVVGSVCMDLTMVDVSDIPGSAVGEEAVLFGHGGGESIRVEEVAAWAHTIPYEILCGISSRVPRIYKKGEKVFEG